MLHSLSEYTREVLASWSGPPIDQLFAFYEVDPTNPAWTPVVVMTHDETASVFTHPSLESVSALLSEDALNQVKAGQKP